MKVRFNNKEYKITNEAEVEIYEDGGNNFWLRRYYPDGKSYSLAMSMEAFIESLAAADKRCFTKKFVREMLLIKSSVYNNGKPQKIKEFNNVVNQILGLKNEKIKSAIAPSVLGANNNSIINEKNKCPTK